VPNWDWRWEATLFCQALGGFVLGHYWGWEKRGGDFSGEAGHKPPG